MTILTDLAVLVMAATPLKLNPPLLVPVALKDSYFHKRRLRIRSEDGRRIPVQELDPVEALMNLVVADKPYEGPAAATVRLPLSFGKLIALYPNDRAFRQGWKSEGRSCGERGSMSWAQSSCTGLGTRWLVDQTGSQSLRILGTSQACVVVCTASAEWVRL